LTDALGLDGAERLLVRFGCTTIEGGQIPNHVLAGIPATFMRTPMLNPKDREAIDGLFWRLQEVEGKAGPRDPEAEALIARRVGEQPGAPYYMAQTILVQETALKMAEERIADLERKAGEQSQRQPARSRGPWEREDNYDDRRGGGGFLAGAAQTALGVTGGVLIGSAIASMLAGTATAGEASPSDATADQPAEDSADTGEADGGSESGGGEFDGGDFGDGGFDMGGDF
jgi:hypothetical protein